MLNNNFFDYSTDATSRSVLIEFYYRIHSASLIPSSAQIKQNDNKLY